MTVADRQALIEENHNLIYSFLKRMRLTIDDYYDLAAIGLCKAAMTYNKKRAAFSTYAYRCMYNAVVSYWRKEEKHIHASVSLDAETFLEANTGGSCIGILEYGEIHTADFQHALQKLPEFERIILSLWADGYSCREISERYGYSASYIRNKRKHAIRVLREELL